MVEESIIPLDRVTIWYRCHLCYGYLCSVPALRKHAAKEHNCVTIELPKNLPAGAADGKIYDTYDTPYNDPLLSLSGHNLRKSNRNTNSISSSCSLAEDNVPTPSPSELNCGIRVRQLVDLQDDPTSGEEDNRSRVVQENPANAFSSPPRMPVGSPPDSGIQMHDGGSDQFQEDDGHHVNQFVQSSKDEPIPSTSTSMPPQEKVPEKRNKLKCEKCGKSFNNASSLNFHTKKFHTSTQTTQSNVSKQNQEDTSAENLIVTIHRDSTTGTLTLTSSKKDNKRKRSEDRSSTLRQLAPRSGSVSSDTYVSRKKPKLSDENLEDKNVIKTTPVISTSVPKRQTRASNSSRESSFIVPDDDSDDSDFKWSARSLAVKARRLRQSNGVIKPQISSSDSEESNSEAKNSPSPTRKKKVVRRIRNFSPESDVSESPSPRKTRARTRSTKKKSPTPSPPNSSGSDSEAATATSDDSNSGDSSEGELSDRSTTPEGSASLASQSEAENNGNGRNTKAAKSPKKKKRKVIESEDLSSDSDDLFTAVTVRKKKVPKDKAKDESVRDGGREKHTDSPVASEKGSSLSDGTKSLSSPVVPVIKTCKYCDKSFKGDKVYAKHIAEKHQAENFSIDCGHCHKKFATVEAFNIHVKVHNSAESKTR